MPAYKQGYKFKGSMMELVNAPQHAAAIQHYYNRVCESCLTATKESKGGAVSSTEATPATTCASSTSIGTPQNPIDITCEATITTCFCGVGLTASDDGFCQKCWVYFTVLAKAYEFKNEAQAMVDIMKSTASRIETYHMPPPITPSPSQSEGSNTTKGGKPLANCIVCSREFPINLKVNDGHSCTHCINRVKRQEGLLASPPSSSPKAPGSGVSSGKRKRDDGEARVESPKRGQMQNLSEVFLTEGTVDPRMITFSDFDCSRRLAAWVIFPRRTLLLSYARCVLIVFDILASIADSALSPETFSMSQP